MTEKTGFRRVSSESADEHNMLQIREILFGEYSRQTEQQLAEVTTRLDEQDRTLRELIDRRVSLAMEALHKDLDKQGTRQQAALDGLDNALRALLSRTDERMTLLDSDLQDVNHAVQKTLAEQTAAQEQLQQDSVARQQLAELLEAMAQQLRRPDTP